MLSSEAGEPWREVPPWAGFLIRLGFTWPEARPPARRIGLVSMPCDSPAAGLVALGAMRNRLARPQTNDLTLHFERIRSLATGGDNQSQLRSAKRTGRFVVEGIHESGMVWLRQIDAAKAFRMTVGPRAAAEWRFEGEPPVQVLPGERLPNAIIYDGLVETDQHVEASNLVQSDSGICFAGRVAGETSTRSIAAAIRLRVDDLVSDLSQLLTIHGWSAGTVSRVSFFNSRTGQIDRNAQRPSLVVADGDASFLKVLDQNDFQQSDIIGVVHRTLDRERLEAIGLKLASLNQWYGHDPELINTIPPMPRGVSLTVVRRR